MLKVIDMKNTRNAETPLLSCHYKFHQMKSFPQKENRLLFNCLKKLLYSKGAWICTNVVTPRVYWLVNIVQLPAPLNMLLVVAETQFALPRMERKNYLWSWLEAMTYIIFIS